MIIAESTVETVLSDLDADETYQQELLAHFEDKYEDYLTYLGQEILTILDEKEGDFFLFILSVIEECLQRHDVRNEQFELTKYFDIEERMWTLYEDNLKVPFRERITPYFEQIDEEEALAFIEDLLSDDDEDGPVVGNTGRDIIWNCCTAFISISIAKD